jgi:16S rRNA (cytosine1402-N4)-methyltransferase
VSLFLQGVKAIMALERTENQSMHTPVLARQVVDLLLLPAGGVIIDGTLGLGGHSEALLKAYDTIEVIGIDRDEQALKLAKDRLSQFEDRICIVHGNYRDCARIVKELDVEKVDGLLLDLGLSSLQLNQPERGFSFQFDGPLDMRMDQSQKFSAADLVNTSSLDELSNIIFRYGEERFARRVARAIVEERKKEPINTTEKLAKTVFKAIPRRFHPPRIHPATRTFQALRIAVNEELASLEKGLEEAFSVLSIGGVMVVISFHSLEDRIVKNFFKNKALACICPPDLPVCKCDKKVEMHILTKHVVVPTPEEIAINPRARSAKLRAARKL